MQQVHLFDRGRPSLPADLSGLQVHDLGLGAWLGHQPSFLGGHDRLYTYLRDSTRWHTHSRTMYDREVDVPRMMARIPEDGPGHEVLFDLSAMLSAQFERDLSRLSANWYRDGQDSVAPHSDKLGRLVPDTIVAILSVGAPRPFVLKPKAGGAARRLEAGWGDLLIMGGSCQLHFEHAIPKQRSAAGRISVMFRERSAEPAEPLPLQPDLG